MSALALSMRPLRLVLKSPLRTAGGVYQSRQGLSLLLDCAGGPAGLGESTPLPEFGTETLARCAEALHTAAAQLKGRAAPEHLEDVEPLLDGLVDWRQLPAARSGVELALLDVLARRKGVPLSRLLNPRARQAVQVSALLLSDSAAALGEEAARRVASGYRTLKLKVGLCTLSEDCRRLEAVRRQVGDRARIRVDANGAWEEPLALQALRAFADFSPELCEQPVKREDLAALRRLRERAPVQVAADESVPLLPGAGAGFGASGGPSTSPAATLGVNAWGQSSSTPPGGDGRVRDVAQDFDFAAASTGDGLQGAADVLVLKPTVLGGLLRALRLAQRAAALGIGSYVTTSLDGVVAHAAATHLAAALSSGDWASGLPLEDLFEGDFGRTPYWTQQGVLAIPTRSGLGLDGGLR